MAADILVFGTGNFAGRVVCDLAAAARDPVHVVIAGRNEARLAWLRTAAGARTLIFNGKARFSTDRIDLTQPELLAGAIARHRPRVIVQAASAQPAAVISAQGNRWSRLVAEAGLSVTAVFQAQFSLRVLETLAATGHAAQFVNACFPDVVNALLTARGHRVACGIGNIGIIGTAFAAIQPGQLRLLAHYATITPFRSPPADRQGPWPRVWIDGDEISDVPARFRDLQLTPEPALDISGACGVPLLLAMAGDRNWRGHVPGPNGLVGGYPVLFQDGAITLDLPPGLSPEAASAWNQDHEELLIEPGGRVGYRGKLHDLLAAISPELARGFHVADLEPMHARMAALRSRLQAEA